MKFTPFTVYRSQLEYRDCEIVERYLENSDDDNLRAKDSIKFKYPRLSQYFRHRFSEKLKRILG